LVSPKNISVQCLLSYNKRALLGESNRHLITANPTTIRDNSTSTWELLRQSSAGILKLGIYIVVESAHRDRLFLGITNSFLYNNQNFTGKSHTFWLEYHLGDTVYKKEAIIDKGDSLFFINGRAIHCKSSSSCVSLHFPVGFPLLSLTRPGFRRLFDSVKDEIAFNNMSYLM
jgi:hypothetical protein